MSATEGRVERLRVYPIKGLDGLAVDAARIREGGTLTHDREFALITPDGTRFNGKQSDRIHELDTEFDPAGPTLTVDAPDAGRERFDLVADREAVGAWFSDFFDRDLTLRRNTTVGFVDRPDMGPSVISTATIETVASWFEDLSVGSVRRRLRANVEVGGVDPFWEDRFVGPDAPAFFVDDVRFEGATPCARCVVPARDPDTGEPLEGFRERFVAKRRETFPDWADREAFDHFYTLMLIARVPDSGRTRRIRTGAPVELPD